MKDDLFLVAESLRTHSVEKVRLWKCRRIVWMRGRENDEMNGKGTWIWTDVTRYRARGLSHVSSLNQLEEGTKTMVFHFFTNRTYWSSSGPSFHFSSLVLFPIVTSTTICQPGPQYQLNSAGSLSSRTAPSN